ncbi:MAG TPA: phosphatase PAP2 family protein [Stellaceae bacterium]|nr:phosphatase PAP2 family protein [Stellaceae bacterium]
MKGVAVYAAALVASLALFWLVPGADLFVSSLFYDPQHGFWLAPWLPIRIVNGSARWLTWAILLVALGSAIWLRLRRRPLWRLDRNALVFLVAALAVGPGIVVNSVLKDHWGRARPYQVTAFGGTHDFTPAPLPADQCAKNCSFVSGHAAVGFSLIGFAFLLPAGRRRAQAIGAALALGGLIGLGRIAAGHHFPSDVIDAGLVVVGMSWLLHRWLVVHDGATPILACVARLRQTPEGRRILWAEGLLLFEAASMIWFDRAVADFFHQHVRSLQPFFLVVQRFGLGWPWLAASALAFAVLRWGGSWERLRPYDGRMRAVAYRPGFIFVAVAAAGLVADVLKITVGRTRPKLLFADGSYDFTWFGLHADHWSFPSGHATTAAALATALWCLWPRPVWLYVAAAGLIAVSRVVTGQHYLSDVVAGAAIGVVVVRVTAAWMLRPRSADPAAAVVEGAASSSPAL